jgi:predicted small metal-binding protein
MKRNLIAALFALVFGLSAATLAFAADMAKSDEAKEPKEPMYSARCPAPCSFSVKSHDKEEVIAILKEHAKEHHNGMVLSDADAEAMVKTTIPKSKS